MILSESKRDNLLLPCLEILQSRGINMTLGQFETKMLEKLSNEGPLTNLSLGSNFYLAGATRYYFNGDLTTNKDLSMLKPEGGQDQWNLEVCQKLNTLIKILRNVHIDSIGTTMEQPEDFGELSLPRLLRKYGAKIKKEMGITDTEVPTEVEDDGINRDENVGNGYTFEIIYSHNEATKYNAATSPGAWCITYDTDTYYNYYIRNLNIHYVIFKQNGWEQIDRHNGYDKSKWKGDKPQDPFGNSLIAVLQSNADGHMVYITSRWNHGYEESCEADHAYTDDEFYQITGTSPADLQRIFQIWKADKPKHKINRPEGEAEERALKKEMLRSLKYVQMRINGGENPSDLLHISDVISGNSEKVTKSLVAASFVDANRNAMAFLMDKGKIIFETVRYFTSLPGFLLEPATDEHMGLKDAVVWGTEDGKYLIYNIRLHKLLDIDGIFKFKIVPKDRWRREKTSVFYEVKMANKKIALVNYSNNIPLKLPNGQCWFYEYFVNEGGWRGTRSARTGEVTAHHRYFNGSEVMEIVYDPASREKYFYSVQSRSFMDIKSTGNVNGERVEPVLNTNFRMNGLFSIGYMRTTQASSEWGRGEPNDFYLFTTSGEQVSINGVSKFTSLKGFDTPKLIIYGDGENREYKFGGRSDKLLYDFKTKKVVCDDEGPIPVYSVGYNGYEEINAVICFIRPTWTYRYDTENDPYPFASQIRYIFDTRTRELVKNPCGWPDNYAFKIKSEGDSYGDGIEYYTNNEDISWPMPEGGWPNVKVLNLSNDAMSVQQTEPAVNLAEHEIKGMVMECIKKILGYGK